MATYYLSSVVGDDATATGAKTAPYATFGAIPIANGDIILVDSRHSSGDNLVGPDITSGAPIRIVSIDWTTGTGAADEAYLPGALFQKGGGFVCRGGVYAYGVTVNQTSSGYWCELGKDVHSDIMLFDSTVTPGPSTPLQLSGPSGGTWYTNRIKLERCTINLASGQRIVHRWGAQAEIIDCALGGSDPASDGVIEASEGYLLVDGLDLSVMVSGALLALTGNSRIVVRNTPLPSGVALVSSAGIGTRYLAGSKVLYASASGSYDVISAEGHASTTTSVSRAGGATLGGNGVSYACITTAAVTAGCKALAVPLDRKVLDLSAAKTLRVYMAQDGGAALTEQDAWVEVRYRRPSDGRSRIVTTRPAAPHLPGAALPTDSTSTWTGLTTPNPQYIDVQIPADVAGDAHAEIYLHVAAPSTTVYVDPAVEVA